MKTRITLLALAALVALVGVSIWATTKQSIVPVMQDLFAHPDAGNNAWFIATSFDAYFGFFWFWAWVAYKETSNSVRIAWLVAICVLGNIAMATYMLLQLRRLPANATAQDLLLRRA